MEQAREVKDGLLFYRHFSCVTSLLSDWREGRQPERGAAAEGGLGPRALQRPAHPAPGRPSQRRGRLRGFPRLPQGHQRVFQRQNHPLRHPPAAGKRLVCKCHQSASKGHTLLESSGGLIIPKTPNRYICSRLAMPGLQSPIKMLNFCWKFHIWVWKKRGYNGH